MLLFTRLRIGIDLRGVGDQDVLRRGSLKLRRTGQTHIKFKCLILHMAIPQVVFLRHRNKVIEGMGVLLGKLPPGFILQGEQHVHHVICVLQIDRVLVNLKVGILRRIELSRRTLFRYSCAESEGQAQPGRHHRQLSALCVDVEGAVPHPLIHNLILCQGTIVGCGGQGCALEPYAVSHIQGHGVGILGDIHIKGNPDLVLPQPIGEPANLCGVIFVRKSNLVQLVACFGRCHSLKLVCGFGYFCSLGIRHSLRDCIEQKNLIRYSTNFLIQLEIFNSYLLRQTDINFLIRCNIVGGIRIGGRAEQAVEGNGLSRRCGGLAQDRHSLQSAFLIRLLHGQRDLASCVCDLHGIVDRCGRALIGTGIVHFHGGKVGISSLVCGQQLAEGGGVSRRGILVTGGHVAHVILLIAAYVGLDLGEILVLAESCHLGGKGDKAAAAGEGAAVLSLGWVLCRRVPDFHSVARGCRNLLGGDAYFIIVFIGEFHGLIGARGAALVDHMELSQIIDNIGIACVIIINWHIVGFSIHAHALSYLSSEAERSAVAIIEIPCTVILPGNRSAHCGGNNGIRLLSLVASGGCLTGVKNRIAAPLDGLCSCVVTISRPLKIWGQVVLPVLQVQVFPGQCDGMIGFICLLCKGKPVLIAAVLDPVIFRIQQVGSGGLSRRVIGDMVEFRINIAAIFCVIWQGNGELQLLKELRHIDVILVRVYPDLPQGKGLIRRHGYTGLHTDTGQSGTGLDSSVVTSRIIVFARNLRSGRDCLICLSVCVDFDFERSLKLLLLCSVPENGVRGQNDIKAVLFRRIFEGIGDGAICGTVSAVVVLTMQLVNAFRRYALRHAAPLRNRIFHHGQPVRHGDLHLFVRQIQLAFHLNVQGKLLGKVNGEGASI